MSKFTALSPLEHDGQRYNPGDAVELDDGQAALLLALVPPAIERPAKIAEPKTQEELIADIRAAIAGMDKDNKALFLADGVTPDTKALSAILGWNVSAADRNLAIRAE